MALDQVHRTTAEHQKFKCKFTNVSTPCCPKRCTGTELLHCTRWEWSLANGLTDAPEIIIIIDERRKFIM